MARMRVINDASTVLIDDENPALALRTSASLTASGQVVPPIDLPNASMPVLALRSATGVVVVASSWTGSTRRFSCLIDWSSPNQSITAYLFDRPLDSGANYGLKMWNASGQLVFDAMQRYGRVVEIRTTNSSFTGPAGRIYAGVIMQYRYREVIEESMIVGRRILSVYQTGVSTSNNSLTVRDVLVSRIEYPSTEALGVRIEYGTPRVMVMDVTGY